MLSVGAVVGVVTGTSGAVDDVGGAVTVVVTDRDVGGAVTVVVTVIDGFWGNRDHLVAGGAVTVWITDLVTVEVGPGSLITGSATCGVSRDLEAGSVTVVVTVRDIAGVFSIRGDANPIWQAAMSPTLHSAVPLVAMTRWGAMSRRIKVW